MSRKNTAFMKATIAPVVAGGRGATASAILGFTNKVTLPDTSAMGPALASLNNRLYLGWKGEGNDNLNVECSSDLGRSFGGKYTSGETSPQAPALTAHNGSLYVAWKGG